MVTNIVAQTSDVRQTAYRDAVEREKFRQSYLEWCMVISGSQVIEWKEVRAGDTVYRNSQTHPHLILKAAGANRWQMLKIWEAPDESRRHIYDRDQGRLIYWSFPPDQLTVVVRPLSINQMQDARFGTRRPMTISALKVNWHDLSAGDVVWMPGSNTRLRIVAVLGAGKFMVENPRGVRSECDWKTANYDYVVVGGPKIQAAQRNPDLTVQTGSNVCWKQQIVPHPVLAPPELLWCEVD